jgi:hypothetical protein
MAYNAREHQESRKVRLIEQIHVAKGREIRPLRR